MKFEYVRILAGSIAFGTAAWAQTPVLSLAQAQQTALQNHPRIASAAFEAQASGFRLLHKPLDTRELQDLLANP